MGEISEEKKALFVSFIKTHYLPKKEEKYELYPLEVNYCNKCHNCQLSVAVDPKKMFSNYLYTSSTSKVFRDHFIKSAKKYCKELKLNKKKSYSGFIRG